MIEVSAAILEQDKKILICQRPRTKACGGLWEFPGGKKEAHESLEQSLIRECQEELGVLIEEPIFYADVEIPENNLHLFFFKTALKSGKLQKKEHEAFAWVGKEDLSSYTFCPSDTRMLAKADKTTLFESYAAFRQSAMKS